MDLTPEFAQHVIDSASKYKECTLEVDRLTSLLQEARLKQKAAESEFRKCLTIEIDCSKAIDTSIGKIPMKELAAADILAGGNGAAIRNNDYILLVIKCK